MLSIIIATYNSENTLPFVLNSIHSQSLEKSLFEVVIVDGGSTDKTKKIARRFKARIIENPNTQQNYGKYLGYLNAKSKYLMYLDSDEVLQNQKSLEMRLKAFNENKQLKMLIGSGYSTPTKYPFINQYVNDFGDPFSFFIYHFSKAADQFIKNMRNAYPCINDTSSYLIFNLSKSDDLPLFELTAGGGMLDSDYVKREFPDLLSRPDLLNHLFYLIRSKSPFIAVTKNDDILHYSSATLFTYLNKISWRVINNIHYPLEMGSSGYTGRNKFMVHPLDVFKKYLFIPYAFSLILPLLDASYLAFTRRQLHYFIHIPLCLYTASLIIFHYFLKTIGITPNLKSYGSRNIIK